MSESNLCFSSRQAGTSGHEILNPRGQVVAWAVDEAWAAVIVSLLNRATDEVGPAANACMKATPTRFMGMH